MTQINFIEVMPYRSSTSASVAGDIQRDMLIAVPGGVSDTDYRGILGQHSIKKKIGGTVSAQEGRSRWLCRGKK